MADPIALPPTGPGAPTPPIEIRGGAAGARAHLGEMVPVPDPVIDRLRKTGAGVSTDHAVRAEASRDWWPGAMIWATEGEVPGLAGVVVSPTDAEQVAAVLRLCNAARVPVTAAGGRSGVCGASVPAFGGVVLDTTALAGVVSIDEESMILDVAPGTFGDHLEAELRAKGLTVGHWPQTVALSTVGGWVACRGAGQLSNKYGKIEDMVVGLDVVLADGTAITTGGGPRAAVGPDLTQVFVGSEGTLGVITGVRLRLHPAPQAQRHAAFGFDSFAAANDACRRIVQRGLPPAVLRVYDAIEADRSYQTGDRAVLLVMDEGDPIVVDATMAITAEVCADAEALDGDLVDRWLSHRNEVSALEALIGKGYVVDTMEISAPWSRLEDIYAATTGALRSVPGTLAASAHQSHAYSDGACLYFTFAAKVDEDGEGTTARDRTYAQLWDVGQRAVLAAGGTLSHHHGVGLNRSRFTAEALGAGHAVLQSVKDALDPNGILNPGKLGLRSPFGEVTYP
ncbi:MAG TPA: FAD-binding oxidoreductase [Acidimicrobiaceae bacterium]|nr:FAD-binding oxidoreductase [Acidimicrobiaceae bacterium]